MQPCRPSRVAGSCRASATAGYRHAAWVVVLTILAATILVATGFGAIGFAAAAVSEFSFHRLNRTYEAFLTDLTPIEIGPATVKLRSPDHTLTLASNRASLAKAGDGSYDARLQIEFSGHGTIIADVTLGTLQTQIQDELTVPLQALELRSRVTVTVSPEGYTILPLELPSSVPVRIESRVAQRLFAICRPMALVLVSLDCALLERSLTLLDVPLPPAGEGYWLPAEELEPEERLRFESFLGGAATVAAPGTPKRSDR